MSPAASEPILTVVLRIVSFGAKKAYLCASVSGAPLNSADIESPSLTS